MLETAHQAGLGRAPRFEPFEQVEALPRRADDGNPEAARPRRHALVSVAPGDLPSWTGTIRLAGVRAFDRLWDVRLEDGEVRVQEA